MFGNEKAVRSPPGLIYWETRGAFTASSLGRTNQQIPEFDPQCKPTAFYQKKDFSANNTDARIKFKSPSPKPHQTDTHTVHTDTDTHTLHPTREKQNGLEGRREFFCSIIDQQSRKSPPSHKSHCWRCENRQGNFGMCSHLFLLQSAFSPASQLFWRTKTRQVIKKTKYPHSPPPQ